MVPLIIGGNSGVGLSAVKYFLNKGADIVYAVGKTDADTSLLDANLSPVYKNKVVFIKKNLIDGDLSFLKELDKVDTLIITAGFGRVSLFENLADAEIKNLFKVNLEVIARIIKFFYPRIDSQNDFYTSIMVSIAGRLVSPFFSVYGATKAGLRFLIENINAELRAKKRKNRILEVSPGSLKGTSFNGEKTNLSLIDGFVCDMMDKMYKRESLFIPAYESTFEGIIKRYQENPIKFGEDSYKYKLESGRISNKPQLIVGYLSGTFDLFHIGHLNLLKRAKEQCDYLIVSVHNSGSWKGKETFIPYEERRAIVEAIKYVDEVVEDFIEDSDAWDKYKYDKLFVGSDYKGTERFNRYEIILKGKAEIIYFPYTAGTSSTQLREALKKK